MRGHRWWAVAAALGVVLSMVVTVGAGAEEPASPTSPGGALVQACLTLPSTSPSALPCKGLDSLAVSLATECEHVPFLTPEPCAELTDGRPIDPAAVTAFADGWVPRALRLQGYLDEDQPLRNELIPHTHNSFNAPQYGPSLTLLDPNQRYTMTDQLRMGIRGLEMDIHWVPLPTGLPTQLTDLTNHVVLCHGQVEAVGSLQVHVGCSIDRPLADGLDELAAYLRQPGNEREVVFLYLENNLDGDATAHAATVTALEQHLGDLVYRPTSTTPGLCQSVPMELTRDQVLAAGHQVVLLGNCGPAGWSSWVFERGPLWDEHANTTPYPSFPACEADRAARGYDTHLTRVYEDSTFLSAATGAPAPITEPEVRAMVRCGVDWIGLDRIGPRDPRLPDLVWSWAPGEPSTASGCAAWGTDARFRAAPCDELRPPACQTSAGGWVVPPDPVAWADAAAACASVGATFAVPRSGWQDEQLRAVGEGISGGLWLPLSAASGWRPT